MTRDTLATVIRLRRSVVNEASVALVECIRAEAAATAAVKAAGAAITRERRAAEELAADDADVEAFSAWLKRGRAGLERTRAIHERAAAETARARATLAAARATLEAAETLHAAREQKIRAGREHKEQLDLDEAGRRPQAPARPRETS
jgi:hypothetical protein